MDFHWPVCPKYEGFLNIGSAAWPADNACHGWQRLNITGIPFPEIVFKVITKIFTVCHHYVNRWENAQCPAQIAFRGNNNTACPAYECFAACESNISYPHIIFFDKKPELAMGKHGLKIFLQAYDAIPFPFFDHGKELVHKIVLVKTIFEKTFICMEISGECFKEITAFFYKNIAVEINIGRVGISFMKQARTYLFEDFFFGRSFVCRQNENFW